MKQPPYIPEYASPIQMRVIRYRTGWTTFWEVTTLPISLLLYGGGACVLIAMLYFGLMILTGSGYLGFPNMLAGVLAIPMIASAVVAQRRRRATTIIGYLHQAVRLNLPIPRVLAAAAHGESTRTKDRIHTLMAHLETGQPLGQALAEAVPEISERTLGLIDFASWNGQLDQTLDRLMAEDLKHARQQRNDQAFAAWYPMLMVILFCIVIGLLDVFVAPKFVQIFKDFRVQLPAAFVFEQSIANSEWILAPVMMVILLACLGYQLRRTLGIYPPIPLLAGWWDEIAWRLPLLHTLIRDRNMHDVCQSLADSIGMGYPLDTSLERLGRLKLNTVLRQRIANWRLAMGSGLSPADAARHARMPNLMTGMITTARDTAGLGEVFAFVARFHNDRFLIRREAVRAAVIPVFTIVMGLVVLGVALSIFIPIQQLAVDLSW